MNPFSKTRSKTAAAWGEARLIETIREWLDNASPPSPHGIGDDCAVFSTTPRTQALVTTDPVLWGRHFDETVSPTDVAGKLFKRNLSDIAAMGGRPRVAVISLLLPSFTSLEWLRAFHLGLRAVALHYDVPIAGGDVSQTDGLLGACMTLIGETTGERALTRKGASAGDHLCVTGSLGGSRLGRHFNFEPRLREGQWLAGRPEAVACIDISDGLAKDLPALVPPHCVAQIFPEAVPISPEAKATAAISGLPPLQHALCDGEDHELLVALKQGTDLDQFLREWNQQFQLPLTRIAVLQPATPGEGTNLLRGLPPELTHHLAGYEHLREA